MKSLLPQWCTPLSVQACACGSADLSAVPIDAVRLNLAASQGSSEIRRVQIGRADIRGRQQCYRKKDQTVFVADTVPQPVGCRIRRTEDVETVTAFRPPIRSFCCTQFIARNSVCVYIRSFCKGEWISTPVGTHTLEQRACTLNDNVPFAFNLNGTLCSKPSISKKFLVCSQGGTSGRRNWLNRILFEPFRPEDFPLLDDETDLDEADQGSRDDKLDGDGGGGGDDDDDGSEEDEIDRMLKDDASFEAWKRRAEARTELQENQKLGRDPDNTDWEDWLDDSWAGYSNYTGQDNGWYTSESDWEKDGVPRPPPELPERGMGRSMKEFLFRILEPEDEVKDELVFEEKVFRYTSQTTAKFVAMLVVVPWLVGYLSHDFLIVPFLNRYVETVPLAAQILDVRESQKLQMIEKLKLERQRVRFEAAIGKSPSLSQDELREHIREEALEMREELRLENRKAFANIWSDILAGLTVFLLLFFNPRKVAIMRLTGTRLFTNISDTGKAFIIILLSDIFLGYHSESGWETIVEMFLEHYGFEVDQAAIYIFVAIVPVTIDACFKLWVFRFLTRLSPSAAATFREMKRH